MQLIPLGVKISQKQNLKENVKLLQKEHVLICIELTRMSPLCPMNNCLTLINTELGLSWSTVFHLKIHI